MLDEGLQVVGAPVAIVDVVGVLPHVAAEDRLAAMDQRALAVRRLGDDDLAVLHGEPAPARPELGHAGLGEVLLHLGAAAARLHPLPEVEVIVVLARIVEEAGVLAERALDDLLQALAFEARALQQVVAVVDVVVVGAVVVFVGPPSPLPPPHG